MDHRLRGLIVIIAVAIMALHPGFSAMFRSGKAKSKQATTDLANDAASQGVENSNAESSNDANTQELDADSLDVEEAKVSTKGNHPPKRDAEPHWANPASVLQMKAAGALNATADALDQSVSKKGDDRRRRSDDRRRRSRRRTSYSSVANCADFEGESEWKGGQVTQVPHGGCTPAWKGGRSVGACYYDSMHFKCISAGSAHKYEYTTKCEDTPLPEKFQWATENMKWPEPVVYEGYCEFYQ